MKKSICIILIGLFVQSFSPAQTTDRLTNTSIIKMAKANLADDIILDEINNSPANFNMCEDSIKTLTAANVSPQIIEAMKQANNMQTVNPAQTKTDTLSVIPKDTITQVNIQPKDTLSQVQPVSTPVKEVQTIVIPVLPNTNKKNSIEKESFQINALMYTAPINNLVIFFNNEFDSFNSTVTGWDHQIKDSLEKVNNLNQKIKEVEIELKAKKNADANTYSQDILVLKKVLTDYRTNYKQLKYNILQDGLKISKDCKNFSKEIIHSVSNKFNEVSQQVNSTNSNPSDGEKAIPVTFIKHKINDNITDYVAPSTELLFWYQNENAELKEIIVSWNSKITVLLLKDTELNNQLKPLKSKLEEYKSNSKKYKSDISTLKKQCSSIEKERKQLANQMNNDKKQLSATLKQIRDKVQNSLTERFNDIIENINYSYQEKLN